MRTPQPFTLIIFGGTGDLSRRKLFPALQALHQGGHLPPVYRILALGRKSYNDTSFREFLSTHHSSGRNQPWDELVERVHFLEMDVDRPEDMQRLKMRLDDFQKEEASLGNQLYYLATPPDLYAPICHSLAKAGLTDEKEGFWRRVIVEKPFGHSLETAKTLNEALSKVLHEEQIYRIDHYLGKETVQNIFALRFGNGIFEPTWNHRFIHHVEVSSSESIGVEGRGAYYEHAGVLRDMIQNHLLQLLAIVAMEPPEVFEADAIRDAKVAVLKTLRPLTPETIPRDVVRGQYINSKVRGEAIPGYRQEGGVAPNSKTETFVALKVHVDSPRWEGVPFYVRSGKRLPTRVTEVVIHYKAPDYDFFPDKMTEDTGENQLVIRIQPDEGILLKLGMKVPGAGFKLKTTGMDFHYSDMGEASLPDAYERLVLDALVGDSTLYARTDGVEAAWAFIDPILNQWSQDPKIKLYGYPAGTWGPPESSLLFDDEDEDWRYPCKNLTGEETFCEL